MANFKNWTAQNLSCFSTKIKEKGEIENLPKTIILRISRFYEKNLATGSFD